MPVGFATPEQMRAIFARERANSVEHDVRAHAGWKMPARAVRADAQALRRRIARERLLLFP